jgi:5'/3'-nucleotidase
LFILVTNDDGVHSAGLAALVRALKALGRVVVVAPDRERSAASHSLTLHSPLRAAELRPDVFAIDGTPTDCVNLALHGLLESRPDIVMSGINRGANLGDDITYSGTVSAAMEATLMGVPAVALSLTEGPFESRNFIHAGRLAAEICRYVMTAGLPRDTFLNVNIPKGKPKGIQMTRQGKRQYQDMMVEKIDPRGKKYYWIGGAGLGFEDEPGTDSQAVGQREVSVTPLHLDLTNYRSLQQLQQLPEALGPGLNSRMKKT